MRILFTTSIASALAISIACGGNVAPVPPPNTNTPSANTPKANAQPTALPLPTNGTYPGKGKVTKIDIQSGSVELDHDEIKGVMPKMVMQFFVKDKSMLSKVAVGDLVDFTLEYKDNRESIIKIEKAK